MKQSRRSPSRRTNWVTRHPVLTVVLLPVIPGVIAAVVSLGLEYGWFVSDQDPSASSDPTAESSLTTSPPSSSRTPPAQVLSEGHAVLVTVDGLDLDTGKRGDQNVLGMDISPSGDGKQINGMTHGKPKMAVVTAAEPTGPELCETVPLTAWTTPLPGLYGMRVGDRICVQTDQGNYGVLTLRVVPSAAAVQLDVDYVAWDR